MAMRHIIVGFSLMLIYSGWSHADPKAMIQKIAQRLLEPENYLSEVEPLVVMGNASLRDANIVFLPEVHDYPESLLTQLLMIAAEKKSNKPFLILDESLSAMKKSSWDVFSQKALEIVVAQDQRLNNRTYAPSSFENELQKLAMNFKDKYRKLSYVDGLNIYSFDDYRSHATPFFGWDKTGSTSLIDRNMEMVDTLKKVLRKNSRILVMAGARHVPELEFLTSQKLMCSDSQFDDIDQYFHAIGKKHGSLPKLDQGIGATKPIHDFLSQQSYAVVFNKGLFGELDDVVKRFKKSSRACLRLRH